MNARKNELINEISIEQYGQSKHTQIIQACSPSVNKCSEKQVCSTKLFITFLINK